MIISLGQTLLALSIASFGCAKISTTNADANSVSRHFHTPSNTQDTTIHHATVARPHPSPPYLSFLSSFLTSLAANPTAMSSAISRLAANTSITVEPALSSLMSSLAAHPTTNMAPSGVSSILGLWTAKPKSTPVASAVSSTESLITASPVRATGAPGLSHPPPIDPYLSSLSALVTSLAANPKDLSRLISRMSVGSVTVAPALSSAMSYIAANPTTNMASSAVASIVSLMTADPDEATAAYGISPTLPATVPDITGDPVFSGYSSLVTRLAANPTALYSLMSSLSVDNVTLAPALSTVMKSLMASPTSNMAPSAVSSIVSLITADPDEAKGASGMSFTLPAATLAPGSTITIDVSKATTTVAAQPSKRDLDGEESVSHQLQATSGVYDMTIYHIPIPGPSTTTTVCVPKSTITSEKHPSERYSDGEELVSHQLQATNGVYDMTIYHSPIYAQCATISIEATAASLSVQATSASLSSGTTTHRPLVARGRLEATPTAAVEPSETDADDDDTDDDADDDIDNDVVTATSTMDGSVTQEVMTFSPVTTVTSTSTLSASGVILHSAIPQTGTITEPAMQGVTSLMAYTTITSPSTHIISNFVVHGSVSRTIPLPTTLTTSKRLPTTTRTPSKQVISFSVYTTVSSLSTFVASNFVLHVESTGDAQSSTSVETTVGITSSPLISTTTCVVPQASVVTTTVPPPPLTTCTTTVTSSPGSTKTCPIPSAQSGPVINVKNKVGPGINNVPIKSISGEGEGGKKITYPNMQGSALCKKAKHCVAIDNKGPVVSCLEDLKNKIHYLAAYKSDLVFEPMQPIACSPALNSKYCAFIELVPWQPKNGKNTELFNQMNTVPYRLMEYNQVNIGAIAEGIDWMKKTTKAKLCGSSLLPVPEPGSELMGRHEEKGKVYVLRVDVNPGLPPMDDDIIEAYADFPGSKR